MKFSIEGILSASQSLNSRYATWGMRALRQIPNFVELFKNHPNPNVRLDYLRSSPENCRDMLIWRSCPIIGAVGPTLSTAQKSMIESIFSVHHSMWQAGQLPEPRCQKIYAEMRGLSIADCKNVRILIVLAKHINCDPDYIVSEIYLNMFRSARNLGLEVDYYPGDDFLYDFPSKPRSIEKSLALSGLSEYIARTKPDIVLTDGNFVPTEATIDDTYWVEAKSKHNFKLVFFIGDFYDGSTSVANWLKCADVVLVPNDTSLQIVNTDVIVRVPCVPYCEDFFSGEHQKEFGMSCIGSASRGRPKWISAFSTMGLPLNVQLGDRRLGTSLPYEDYCVALMKSRLVFNTGYVADNVNNVITGRLFEGILSSAVVIDEHGSGADDFFIPFVHYVPIANIDQAIAFSMFLLERDDWRKLIAQSALSQWRTHYSSDNFWKMVISKTMMGRVA